jgi:single-strand DNA-binding protein
MQIIQIIGTLGNDPESSVSAGGVSFAKFSVAVNRKDKQKGDTTTWYRCTAFGKQAETILQYVKKGQKIFVSGDLQVSANESNGKTYVNTDVIVSRFEFIDSAKAPAVPQPAAKPAEFNDADVLF